MNEHIEKPREVPEISTSSLFPEEKNNFTVAFTIYPFHHDSELFPDVQYAEACRPFALQVTVNCPR